MDEEKKEDLTDEELDIPATQPTEPLAEENPTDSPVEPEAAQ